MGSHLREYLRNAKADLREVRPQLSLVSDYFQSRYLDEVPYVVSLGKAISSVRKTLLLVYVQSNRQKRVNPALAGFARLYPQNRKSQQRGHVE